MSIFKESQLERDQEISDFTGVPLAKIQTFEIASQKSIKINVNGDMNKDDYTDLYKDYKHLNLAEYLKTLSALTVSRRSKYIIKMNQLNGGISGKMVLDFGSGVGSHGIACYEYGAEEVHFLDVDGPLMDFAKWRVQKRNYNNTIFMKCEDSLPIDHYDFIICLDVLEHVSKPMLEIKRITESLKPGGIIALEVSTMIKPTSGHFSKPIKDWKIHGPAFLNDHYINVSKNIWRKK